MPFDAYNTDSFIGIFILIGAAAFVYKAFKEDGIKAAFSALLRVVTVLFGAALLLMVSVALIGIAIEYTHWIFVSVLALVIIFNLFKK